MSGSVFDLYHKYFESLINQHKANCETDRQSQQHHMPQPQPIQEPPPQQLQYQPQQYLHQDHQHPWQLPPMPPHYHQQPPHGRQHQGFYPNDSRRRHTPQPHPAELPSIYGYYGRGGPRKEHTRPTPWHHQPPTPHPQPPQMSQDDLRRFYFNNRRQVQAPPLPQYPRQQLLPQSQIPTPFQPDGQVGEAPEDEAKRKPTFCYPSGVSGYKGTVACSPCSSCNQDAAADKSAPPVETLEQYLQQRSAAQSMQPEQQQEKQQPQQQQSEQQTPTAQARSRSLSPHIPQQQQQQSRRPPKCKDCPSSSPANGEGKEGESRKARKKDGEDQGENYEEDGDSKQRHQRLPLNARTPFTVGKTTYQYFYDTSKL